MSEKKTDAEHPPDQETVKLNAVLIGLGILAVLVGVVSGLVMSHATLVR